MINRVGGMRGGKNLGTFFLFTMALGLRTIIDDRAVPPPLLCLIQGGIGLVNYLFLRVCSIFGGKRGSPPDRQQLGSSNWVRIK